MVRQRWHEFQFMAPEQVIIFDERDKLLAKCAKGIVPWTQDP